MTSEMLRTLSTGLTLAAILATWGSTTGTALAAPLNRRTSGVWLHPGTDTSRCLAVISTPAEEALVKLVPCSLATSNVSARNFALWDVSYGEQTMIEVHGTGFCLDNALSHPAHEPEDGKIAKCSIGEPKQRWYFDENDRIGLVNSNLCLSHGHLGVVTFECGAVAGQTFTMSVPGDHTAGDHPVQAPSDGQQVRLNGDSAHCLTAGFSREYGDLYRGEAVTVSECLPRDDYNAQFQQWVVHSHYHGAAGTVQLADHNLCLDFGVEGGIDGEPMKLWSCDGAQPQQSLLFLKDGHLAIQHGSGQCLEVRENTVRMQNTRKNPYRWQKVVQSARCVEGEPRQVWKL